MRYALSFSGGKDSMLALDRAVRGNLPVAYLFNIFEGSSGRVRFHGTRAELIAAQAEALGLPLLQDCTHPDDYETVFERVLDRLQDEQIDGIIFGNIHLADIRAWYEERVRAHGFQHIEPLWNGPGPALIGELLDRGYEARIASVDLAQAPEEWLGRTIDRAMLAEIAEREELDPCGERGEYHTFVENGPLFKHPVRPQLGKCVVMEGHALVEMTLGE